MAELNEKSARKLWETKHKAALAQFSPEIHELIFQLTLDESRSVSDTILWNSAGNSYDALMKLIADIRVPGDFHNTHTTEYGDVIASAPNKISAAFSILRKHRNLSSREVQTILEIAHSTALTGVSSEGRNALFAYADDRGVDALEVANIYSNLADLVALVKRPLYPELV